jgi:hypothetical protein
MKKPIPSIQLEFPDDEARTRDDLLAELNQLRMENAYLKSSMPCSSRHCCTTSHGSYRRRAFMRFAAMRRLGWTACRGENKRKVFSSG